MATEKSLDNFSDTLLEDSGCPKSLDDRKKSNKYDHIQSKVKGYIEEIKLQQRGSKERRQMAESKWKLNEESTTLGNSNNSCNSDSSDDEYKKIIDELEICNEMLKEDMCNLILENSDKQLRIESMRKEINALQTKLENLIKEDTPRTTRNIRHSLFRTPIRTISNTLATSFRSASKSTLKSDVSSLDVNPIIVEKTPSQLWNQSVQNVEVSPKPQKVKKWKEFVCCLNTTDTDLNLEYLNYRKFGDELEKENLRTVSESFSDTPVNSKYTYRFLKLKQ